MHTRSQISHRRGEGGGGSSSLRFPPLYAKKGDRNAILIPIIFPGSRKISENELNRRTTRHRTNKVEGNTSRECIEIDDDDIEEKENKDNNVSKNRKTTKQNSRVAQKTPRKEVKTPRKTPKKEAKTSRKTPQKGRHIHIKLQYVASVGSGYSGVN